MLVKQMTAVTELALLTITGQNHRPQAVRSLRYFNKWRQEKLTIC